MSEGVLDSDNPTIPGSKVLIRYVARDSASLGVLPACKLVHRLPIFKARPGGRLDAGWVSGAT